MKLNNVLGKRNKPIYKPEICRVSAGAQKGVPWQPFSYEVKQDRGQRVGTHHKSEN